jgi:hypothetical protein
VAKPPDELILAGPALIARMAVLWVVSGLTHGGWLSVEVCPLHGTTGGGHEL